MELLLPGPDCCTNINISCSVQILCLQEVQEDHFLEQMFPVLTDMGEVLNINRCQNSCNEPAADNITVRIIFPYGGTRLQKMKN